MSRKPYFYIPFLLILFGVIIGILQTASAAGAKIGCNPYNLTVKTGQTFYITVAVTDTIDLYAWQMDLKYYPEYLEFDRLVAGSHLRSDGTSNYQVEPSVVTETFYNVMSLAALTRLSNNRGVDGSGSIAHIYFHALKQKLDGSAITISDWKLVDRNALEISSTRTNSGLCRITISDSAPPLDQLPIDGALFLPFIVK